MFKTLIYSHDTFGVGHLSRAIKLSKAILSKRKDAAIIIVTGSAVLNLIDLPKGVELIKIPSLKSIRKRELSYESFNTNINPETILKIREAMLIDIVKEFNPDILLVDFSPKGVKGELFKSLEYIKKKLNTKIYITFRDIIDEPSEVINKWERRNYDSILKKYYDRILIFGDKKINDFASSYKLKKGVVNKIVYLGYLVERKKQINKRRKKILLTVGGGRDGYGTIIKFLKNFLKIKRFKDYKLEVVCGPLSNKKNYKSLFNTTKKNKKIKVSLSIPNLNENFNEYSLIVCMCGYNTFCDILGNAIPSLIIPRESFEREQLIRAKIFEDKGIISYIRLKDLNKKNLEEKLLKALNSKNLVRKINKINTRGISNFKGFIK